MCALLQTSKPPKRGELSALFVMMTTSPLHREGLTHTNTVQGGSREHSYKLVRSFTSMWMCMYVDTHGLCSACRVSHLLQSFSGARDTQFVPRLYKTELPDTHKCSRLYSPGHEVSYYKDAGSVWAGEDGETSG